MPRYLKKICVRQIVLQHEMEWLTPQACLRSLSFPQMNDRLEQSSTYQTGTCKWLLTHPNFIKFQSSQTSLLWLKGNPGTGKSTLMSFLHSAYRDMPSYAQGICLDFFFLANGVTLQKTKLGMFRGLLYQLCRQSRWARKVILSTFQEKEKGFGSCGEKWEWTADELAVLFEKAVAAQPPKGREITIFIDALDEAVNEDGKKIAPELIGYFGRLIEDAMKSERRIRVCLSCRHYPVAAANLGSEIHVEVENRRDLAVFVRHHLDVFVEGWNDYSINERTVLEATLVEKAGGCFLWAKLKLEKLIRSLNDGTRTLADLQILLEDESNELGALYKDILTNDVDPSSRRMALLFLQWICLAERPLSIEEIRYAMACDESVVVTGQMKCEESNGFIESDLRMGKLAKSLSGGLVKVLDGEHRTLQPFHATVTEYLRANGLQLLCSLSNDDVPFNGANMDLIGAGENRLSQSCLNYLKMGNFLEDATVDFGTITANYPLAEYATRFWLAHASRAERRGFDQEGIMDVLNSSPKLFKIWKMLYYTIDKYDPKRPARYTYNTIHVASAWNLQSVVHKLLARDAGVVYDLDDGDNQALHHASRFGNEDIVAKLLDSNANINAKNSGQATPLELAAANGHEKVVKLLLQNGADVETATGNSGNALQSAAHNGNVALAEILILSGADVNARCGQMGSALNQAANKGHLRMVELLLSHGAKVNDEGGYFGTALHSAVMARTDGRRDEIIQTLLNAGADPNSQGCEFGNAFQAAASKNRLKLVKLFLAHGADINASDGSHGTALHAACAAERDELIDFLLDAGARIDVPGGLYGSPLQAAAHIGSTKYVKIMLERGANIHEQGGMYGSALQAGCASLGVEVVDILLAAGADIHKKGGYFGNMLQAAISGRNYILAKRLLNEGLDINEQGGTFGNALQAAIVDAKADFVEFLLHVGAEPNAVGGHYGTALRAAVVLQREPVVKILLTHGANPNVEWIGSVALQIAARHKCNGILRMLLDYGSNVNFRGSGWESTPLYGAIIAGQRENVALLLERGARMDLPAEPYKNGWEAAMYNLNMLKFLAEHFRLTSTLDDYLKSTI